MRDIDVFHVSTIIQAHTDHNKFIQIKNGQA